MQGDCDEMAEELVSQYAAKEIEFEIPPQKGYVIDDSA